MTTAILKVRPAAAPRTDAQRGTRELVRLRALDHTAWQHGARWRDRAPARACPPLVCRWHQDADGRLICIWEPDD